MNKALVVQFEITGQHAARLHTFYRNLFGWHLHDTPGTHSAGYKRTSAAETGLAGAIGPTRSGRTTDQVGCTLRIARTRLPFGLPATCAC
jgi:predicted enzyme related to lactoylglutathione lyase